MSCPYYWYDNHYACRKSGKDVNEDIYYKYCRDYDYDDCPIYKGQDSSGCFLTSACVEAKGLPDDCYELMVLRRFRDEWLCNQPGGNEEIAEYYHMAPSIVEEIKSRPNYMDVFIDIYDELVCRCVAFIDSGKNAEAHELYRSYVLKLKKEYKGD